jgi:ElaB/YqjD/DUF883 family membrane-anchored ribosome-binding protein
LALVEGQKETESRLGELLAATSSLAHSMSILSDKKLSGGDNANEGCKNAAVDTSFEAQRGLQELQELLLRKDELFREEYDVALSEVQALRVEMASVVEAQKEYIGVLTSQIEDLTMALDAERRRNHELSTILNRCITEDNFDAMVADRLHNVHMEGMQGDNADSICFTSHEAFRQAVDMAVHSDMGRLSNVIKESTSAEIDDVLSRVRDTETRRLEVLQERELAMLKAQSAASCDKCITIGEAKGMIRKEVADQCSTHQQECEKIEPSPVFSTAEPDHAQRGAGAIVMHEFTSPTYSRPRDRGSAADVVASVWDSMSDYFGLENGIGRPEDALSHKVTLGQCWAMNVGFPIAVFSLLHSSY